MTNSDNFQVGKDTSQFLNSQSETGDMQIPTFHDFVEIQQQLLYNYILRSLLEGRSVEGVPGVRSYSQGQQCTLDNRTLEKVTLEQVVQQQYGNPHAQQQHCVQSPEVVPFIQQQTIQAPIQADIVVGVPVDPQYESFQQSYYMQLCQHEIVQAQYHENQADDSDDEHSAVVHCNNHDSSSSQQPNK